ncbi:MAG TPA: VOC family protein [Micropepsaceae bacterium]|jgi:uncharacterized glyoxalase superfamily protein PhnB
MTQLAKDARCTTITTLRYHDANAAIEFLCDAFGFSRHLVVPGPGNTVAHAQLSFGNGMIMLGSHPHEGEFGKWIQPPQAPAMVNTHSVYVVVADVDAHHARAQACGANIIRPLTDQDYGGRDYSARDPEGYVWSFGTYDPWA